MEKEKERLGIPAWIIVNLEKAHVQLIGERPNKCKEIIEEIQTILDSKPISHHVIYSQFYRVCLQYYKV